MLRQQGGRFGPMDFLAGAGEMAQRIRQADWSAHPFGPTDTWPQSLRAALSICLHSAFPTAIYWGPDLRLLYNDAWAPIPGPRHPASLGAPAREVWSDIWSIIEPQFNEVIVSGQGLFLKDQMLPMQRFGVLEETYWNYSFTPLRGETGEILGVWNSGSETTENVISRRNADYMVKLNETLRGCESAELGVRTALERLGTHLGADLICLLEDDAAAGLGPGAPASEIYLPQSAARRPAEMVPFGPTAQAKLRAGQHVRMDRGEAGLEAAALRYLDEHGVSSVILVPWKGRGAQPSVLAIHWARRRSIGVLDVALVEKVLETIMVWRELEWARAREVAMRHEIDHRARNILAILRGVARLVTAGTVTEYKSKLDDRIAALSRIHGLLSQRNWEGLSLHEVIETELDACGVADPGKLRLSGPDVRLSAGDAQLLAMLVHELGINAREHGALGVLDGLLEIGWSSPAAAGTLALTWRERSPAIRPLTAPAAERQGFGTILMQRVVKDHFQGRVERHLVPGELRYSLMLSSADWGGEAGAPTAVAEPQPEVRSVMIVEDEPIIALDLAGMLEDAGYAIFGQYGTVSAALDSLAKHVPDLALLDENLGGERSTAVQDKLRALGVPVVIISGYEGEAMTGVPRLAKPISEAELLGTLKNL